MKQILIDRWLVLVLLVLACGMLLAVTLNQPYQVPAVQTNGVPAWPRPATPLKMTSVQMAVSESISAKIDQDQRAYMGPKDSAVFQLHVHDTKAPIESNSKEAPGQVSAELEKESADLLAPRLEPYDAGLSALDQHLLQTTDLTNQLALLEKLAQQRATDPVGLSKPLAALTEAQKLATERSLSTGLQPAWAVYVGYFSERVAAVRLVDALLKVEVRAYLQPVVGVAGAGASEGDSTGSDRSMNGDEGGVSDVVETVALGSKVIGYRVLVGPELLRPEAVRLAEHLMALLSNEGFIIRYQI